MSHYEVCFQDVPWPAHSSFMVCMQYIKHTNDHMQDTFIDVKSVVKSNDTKQC